MKTLTVWRLKIKFPPRQQTKQRTSILKTSRSRMASEKERLVSARPTQKSPIGKFPNFISSWECALCARVYLRPSSVLNLFDYLCALLSKHTYTHRLLRQFYRLIDNHPNAHQNTNLPCELFKLGGEAPLCVFSRTIVERCASLVLSCPPSLAPHQFEIMEN